MSPVERGVRTLRRLLGERNFDLRDLDLPGFRGWLHRQLAGWQEDPIFVQRTKIRDLRSAEPRIGDLEAEYRRAAAADARSTDFTRLQQLERELTGARKAIAGLSGALLRIAPEKRADVRRKRNAFQARQRALTQELARLTRLSRERQALLRAAEELHRLRSRTRLDRAEARLRALLKERGRRSGRAGESFERTALSITRQDIVPDLVRSGSAESAARLGVVRGVTLGASRIEFDQLVIRQARRSGRPVEVLAVVEAKRNVNDLARGFLRRQEDLAWLTGDDSGYDPEMYRTCRFQTGHFDREAVHEESGETFLFTRSSFRLFRRCPDGGLFLNRLYFVTRAGPMWGVSAEALSRISFRVATDERWEPDREAYLSRLLRWCRSLATSLETPDVLSLYASNPGMACQILVVKPLSSQG